LESAFRSLLRATRHQLVAVLACVSGVLQVHADGILVQLLGGAAHDRKDAPGGDLPNRAARQRVDVQLGRVLRIGSFAGIVPARQAARSRERGNDGSRRAKDTLGRYGSLEEVWLGAVAGIPDVWRRRGEDE
jgi:hypothetical protein